MAKEKKKEGPKKVRPEEKKQGYFPVKLLLWSFFYIAVVVVDYFGLLPFEIPRYALLVLILIGGLRDFHRSFSLGSYRRRKDILKKYI